MTTGQSIQRARRAAPDNQEETLRKEIRLVVLLFAVLATASTSGCTKAPAPEGSASAPSNSNARGTNSNAADLASTPLYAQTIRGDVERAGLAVMMAHDFVKQQKWGDAVTRLQNAQTQIENALTKKPRLKDDFEAARASLVRTIKATENREEDIEAQFTEIQTRINALKAYTSQ